MVEILNQVGKRKFIIWIIGAGLLSGAIGFGVLDGVYFRDCFISLTGFVIAGNAAEHWAGK